MAASRWNAVTCRTPSKPISKVTRTSLPRRSPAGCRVDLDLHGAPDLGERHAVGVGDAAAGFVEVVGRRVLQRHPVAEPASGAQVGRDHALQLHPLPVEDGASGDGVVGVVQAQVEFEAGGSPRTGSRSLP